MAWNCLDYLFVTASRPIEDKKDLSPRSRPALRARSVPFSLRYLCLTIARYVQTLSVVSYRSVEMGSGPKERRLLFVNADTQNPPTQSTRSKALDSQIRRHLMIDIGKSRRNASKAPQFGTFEWSLDESTETNASRPPTSTSQDVDRVRNLAAQNVTPIINKPPILQAMAVFERQWGEDWFSAYGFTLIMVSGRNAIDPSKLK